MLTCLEHREGPLGVPRSRGLWARMRGPPRGEAPDVTSYGDLMPGNLLVRDVRLTGVIDTGGLGPAADPALDLVCAWHVLEAEPRGVLREALGRADAEWERGRA